jgi:AraC-like DNA-binding protein
VPSQFNFLLAAHCTRLIALELTDRSRGRALHPRPEEPGFTAHSVKAEQLEAEPALETTLRLIVSEISGHKPGSLIAVRRLTDLLFIQALRFMIGQSNVCANKTGLLKALLDPQIGGVLQRMHEKPEAPWTVSSLADAANMSRSSFAAKFAALTNKTPLEYLTCWRMNKAQQMLLNGNENLAKIAGQVGYQSEAAFSKAFRTLSSLWEFLIG